LECPTKDVYDYTEDPTINWNTPDEVIVGFDKGVPVSIDGSPVTVLDAIVELNRRAGAQASDVSTWWRTASSASRAGRSTKRRVDGVDHRAPPSSNTSTLERELGRFKRLTDQRWGELVYDGLWFSPLKTALETFVAKTQRRSPARSGWCCTAAHRGQRAGAAPSRCTTSTWRPMTKGTPSDQSSAKGFRARARPVVENRRPAGPGGQSDVSTNEGSLWGGRFADGPAPGWRR